MSVIKLPLLLVGSKGEKHLYTLFDSGANLLYIAKGHLEKLEDPIHLGGIRRLATTSEGHYWRCNSTKVTHQIEFPG